MNQHKLKQHTNTQRRTLHFQLVCEKRCSVLAQKIKTDKIIFAACTKEDTCRNALGACICPKTLTPLGEVFLDVIVVIAFTKRAHSRPTERCKRFVHVLAHLVELLIRAVAKPKHGKVETLEPVMGK